jgi:hypothetical protein
MKNDEERWRSMKIDEKGWRLMKNNGDRWKSMKNNEDRNTCDSQVLPTISMNPALLVILLFLLNFGNFTVILGNQLFRFQAIFDGYRSNLGHGMFTELGYPTIDKIMN